MNVEIKQDIRVDTSYYRVLSLIHLTNETFIVRMPKSRFDFKAGQHITLAIHGDYQSREYSLYSGEGDEYMEVLVKEVEGGYFTPKLKKLKPGELVEIHGPFGRFWIDNNKLYGYKHVFIASGTGIAPFHSMVKTYPGLDYLLLHGVRYCTEAYEHETYDKEKYISCTSRDKNGDFRGRVTDYLKSANFGLKTVFYLCGNSDMIFDAMEILKEKGFERDDINCEVYF